MSRDNTPFTPLNQLRPNIYHSPAIENNWVDGSMWISPVQCFPFPFRSSPDRALDRYRCKFDRTRLANRRVLGLCMKMEDVVAEENTRCRPNQKRPWPVRYLSFFLARFKASMAMFNAEIVPPRSFGRWGFASIVIAGSR